MKSEINANGKYILVSKKTSGGKIISYTVCDESGNTKEVDKDYFMGLVKENNIVNCEYVECIRGLGISLKEIPSYDIKTGHSTNAGTEQQIVERINSFKQNSMCQIVARLIYNNDCVGFELKSYTGVDHKLSYKSTVEMAKSGLLCNATCKILRDECFLVGIGCDINQLPAININYDISNPERKLANQVKKNGKPKPASNKTIEIAPEPTNFKVVERMRNENSMMKYRLKNLKTGEERVVSRDEALAFAEGGHIKGIDSVFYTKNRKMKTLDSSLHVLGSKYA